MQFISNHCTVPEQIVRKTEQAHKPLFTVRQSRKVLIALVSLAPYTGLMNFHHTENQCP